MSKNKSLKETIRSVHAEERLYPWQKQDIIEVLSIIYQYFKYPEKVTVLDVGCSAEQVKILSKYVQKVVGINLSFPANVLEEGLVSESYELIQMDGTELSFPDQSFDLVYSFNVLEHIHDAGKALAEQKRVVKKRGYIYLAWYPLWSGSRGHHVHDDDSFFEGWDAYGQPKVKYTNNGEFIPDWGHLIYSEEEMSDILKPKFGNDVFTENVVKYIYRDNDLNRMFIKDVEDIFKTLGLFRVFERKNKPVRISKENYALLRSRFGKMDFETTGLRILFYKGSSVRNPGILLLKFWRAFSNSKVVKHISHFLTRVRYKLIGR